MIMKLTRRAALGSIAAAGLAFGAAAPSFAADMTFTLATSGSETDQRSVAMAEVFGPGVADFACFEPHYNGTLFAQGTELEAIARGNLEMSITSAQELAEYIPEFSIFTAGYVHQNAAHQVAVFNDDVFDSFAAAARETLGVELLAVMYLGRRHVNLRQTREELEVMTPADLEGVNLRMPGSEAWQFLGRALGAAPTPMAFTEVYTALQTGAVDGQDNPFTGTQRMKFYEVTDQIVLTNHLVSFDLFSIAKSTWDAMNADQQAKVEECALEYRSAFEGKVREDEAELRAFFEGEGLKVYDPDRDAFRNHVLAQYAASPLSADWPEGLVDAISAVE